MRHDPYDVRIAFDDLYCQVPSTVPDDNSVSRNIFRRARSRRLTIPLRIEPASVDTTARSFQIESGNAVVGASGSMRFPLYESSLRYFQNAQPLTKLLRLDTPVSYIGFREERRAPYRERLDARLRALEEAFAEHVADRHGGGRLSELEAAFERHLDRREDSSIVLGAEVACAAREYMCGGTPVSVDLALQGKVECWQDGDEICCTVRFLSPKGEISVLTTGEPIQRYLEEALQCASDSDLESLLPVVGRVAQVLGSTALIPQLCRSALILSTTGETSPRINVMSAKSAPPIAAAMALLQRCQQGDLHAFAEVKAMQEYGAGALLAEASDRLVRAQAEKARRSM